MVAASWRWKRRPRPPRPCSSPCRARLRVQERNRRWSIAIHFAAAEKIGGGGGAADRVDWGVLWRT
uniref:Uncharacterized protein n=1 Tax=Arundo donax TaxID=35708 RepID=A0A0A9AZP2_ARUDO